VSEDFFGGVSEALGSAVGGIAQTAGSVLGATISSVGAVTQGLGGGIAAFLTGTAGANPNMLMSAFRSQGIPLGAEPNYNYSPVTAQFSSDPGQKDWRVRIASPIIWESQVFAPLANTEGLIFPNVPSVSITHTANYQNINTTHNNFPFYAYNNSQVDEISISGEFSVQDQMDGVYWLGAIHFLRTATKMYFGQGPNLGNPPPVCTLNGYGDFVFNNISIVIKSFTIDLPKDVDYIAVNLGTTPDGQSGSNLSYVPVLSTITVQVLPVFSREKIKSFNLDAFAKGQLIVPGQDDTGFI
jgi:hypothetical protein